MIKLIFCIVLSMLSLPVLAVTDYPANCETYFVKPTTNNPKILNFKIPQQDLQGLPPLQGSFVSATIYLRNFPGTATNIVQSIMQVDNYWGAKGSAHNQEMYNLGGQKIYYFYEDHIQTQNSAYLHFTLSKIGDTASPNPVVGVFVCTFHKN